MKMRLFIMRKYTGIMGEIMVRRRCGLGLTLIERGSQAPQRRLRSTNCFETPFS
ncbi:MAG: hypothetical protein N2V77_05635 [Canidatus Methanoxibalbensis ujae]|nr:hypothetical protein [Candidatus Methanoxibalbensis ujae]MCW7078024.1 hypothetical protein [Candidatus Methanoxibalbensis ujae]